MRMDHAKPVRFVTTFEPSEGDMKEDPGVASSEPF